MKVVLYSFLLRVAPNILLKFQHYLMHSRFGSHTYIANLSKPKTFNEFTISEKNKKNRESLAVWVDKHLAKFKVAERIGDKYMIPTLKYFSGGELPKGDEISFPCILKPTHLSGYTRVFNTKAEFDSFDLSAYWRKVSAINFYKLTGERQYDGVDAGVIFEPLLSDSDGGELKDYKLFCFDGRPEFIQVDLDRKVNHTRTFYDTEWNNQKFSSLYPIYDGEVTKPLNLEEMIEIAQKLSKGFPFVRVDLYNISGQILFGELTFDHGSGNEPFTTYAHDAMMGGFYADALRKNE